jgi:hypothetical protein
MTDQTAPLTETEAEVVTETAPSQKKRGRKPGTKNGQGVNPSNKAKLTASIVNVHADTLYVHLANGISIVYNADGVATFDAGHAQLSAEMVANLSEVVRNCPAAPKTPEEVAKFGQAIGLKYADFDTLSLIRRWVVK